MHLSKWWRAVLDGCSQVIPNSVGNSKSAFIAKGLHHPPLVQRMNHMQSFSGAKDLHLPLAQKMELEEASLTSSVSGDPSKSNNSRSAKPIYSKLSFRVRIPRALLTRDVTRACLAGTPYVTRDVTHCFCIQSAGLTIYEARLLYFSRFRYMYLRMDNFTQS